MSNFLSRRRDALVLALLLSCVASLASAAEPPEVRLVIRNHRFVPAELVVPANTKIKLMVVNEDPTPEEFESHELNREKVVTGNSKIVVFLGPLKPGKYGYYGEFHMKTAQGVLIAK